LSSGGYFNKYTGNLKMKTNNVNSNKIDWITGMGTIIPTKLVVNNGYWDDEKFPHYFADADFTMRAKRNGASLVICNDFKIYNDTSNSGFFHDGKVRRLLKSFFVINSYYNIITRFRINRRYGVLILSDLCVIAYYLKIVFSFIKFILKRTTFFINIKRTFSTS
jgi:GT2 family glycosyltransferase